MLTSTRSDIVLSVRCCGERVHEGVKLLRVRKRKAYSNREQLVLKKAFDFPALENPMLSRWQQWGLRQRGGGFSSIRL